MTKDQQKQLEEKLKVELDNQYEFRNTVKPNKYIPESKTDDECMECGFPKRFHFIILEKQLQQYKAIIDEIKEFHKHMNFSHMDSDKLGQILVKLEEK